MRGPLSKAILTNVRCVKCGVQGYGTCDCWETCPRCGWTIETGSACHHCAGDKRRATVAAGVLPVDDDGVLALGSAPKKKGGSR